MVSQVLYAFLVFSFGGALLDDSRKTRKAGKAEVEDEAQALSTG